MSRISAAIAALLFATGTAAAAELTSSDVKKVMAAHGDEVKECYLRHGMKQPGATGRVVVTAVVNKDGSTRDHRVEAPGVKGTKLSTCIEAAAQDWSFPAIDAPTEVSLPFLFQHTHARGAGPTRGSRPRR